MDFIGVFPYIEEGQWSPYKWGTLCAPLSDCAITFPSELVSDVSDKCGNSFALKSGRSRIRHLPIPFALAARGMVLSGMLYRRSSLKSHFSLMLISFFWR